MIIRRLLLVLSIVVTGSLAFAAAASAAGGFGPGKYTFESSGAYATFGGGFTKGGPSGPSWNVAVNQGLTSFKPMQPNGPRILMNSTVVSLNEVDATGMGGFGCFMVPDSDFTVARDLSSAALHTVLTAAEACPGFASPVGAAGPYAGGGGGGGGLQLPISVDVTWTAPGPTSTFSQSFSISCLDYSIDGSSTNPSRNAAATGTISALPGLFGGSGANVSTSKGTLDIHGLPDPACGYIG